MSSNVQFIETYATRSLNAVRFTHVTKIYQLYKNEQQRALSILYPRIKHDDIYANKDISFTIRRGESVALLGRNGAGKSTVLKIITRVTVPTHGIVEVNGRVSALLDLSSGFDAQLTGRENLRLRSMLWGLSPSETAELMPEIIDFAEIGKYIDQPMRTYSNGMKARLGFAFASTLKPDILILDEVMSVGDRNFSRKSLTRMQEIIARDGITLLFVTHSLDSARKFCQRSLVIEHGEVVFDGEVEKGISYYKKNIP